MTKITKSMVDLLDETEGMTIMILKEFYTEHYLQSTKLICLKEKSGLGIKIFDEIRRRLTEFNHHHGRNYDAMISNIVLSDLNLGRQYDQGANAIVESYTKFTSATGFALITFFTLMVKRCLLNNLESFVPSLIEWNRRMFSKHIVEFEQNGAWSGQFSVNPLNQVDEVTKHQRIDFKCVVCLIMVGYILIIRTS